MHKPKLASLIAKNFVIVEIDVGRFDKNLEWGENYAVPIKKKGIPALAVLDSQGRLLHAEDQEHFSDARHMPYDNIVAFFEKWKPRR